MSIVMSEYWLSAFQITGLDVESLPKIGDGSRRVEGRCLTSSDRAELNVSSMVMPGRPTLRTRRGSTADNSALSLATAHR
jgi:hypothetical protein